MAIGGATVRTSFVQLDEYLTKHSTKPKYVILGLNSTHEEFDIETIHPIIEVSMQGHKYSLNDIPILKFKWLGIEFLKKVISSKHRQARLSYGQLKFQKVISDDTRYKVNYLNTGKFTSSKWINEIAKLCCQNNIVLYILELPGYKELQNSSDVGPYNLVFNSECYTKLYNFNSKDFCEIFDPNKDWIGNSHLNEFGAKKFTETLLEYLVE